MKKEFLLNFNKKVLLLFPNPISQIQMGLAYIGAVFENNSYNVNIAVNTFDKKYENSDFIKIINDFSPSIIGISFSTYRILKIYDLIRKISRPDRLIIAGGPHPTLFPEEVLRHGADIVVIGEGEGVIQEIIDFIDNKNNKKIEDIKGVAYKDDKGIIKNSGRGEFIDNLDTLPKPAFHLYKREDFVQNDGSIKGLGMVFTARGCPYACTFCERSIFGRAHRLRSPSNIVEEIKERKSQYYINDFTFMDDAFTLNRKRTLEICDLLIREKLGIRWNCASRVTSVDEGLLERMREAGCFQVNYGIESGDPDTLKRIKKGSKLEEMKRAIFLTYKSGIRVYANIMTGFPWEGPQHISNTIDLVKTLSPYIYMYSVHGCVVPYPKTAIYEEYCDRFNFRDYWLKEEFQLMGDVIYQNVENPLRHSAYYQRNMYDDTYIAEDIFFKYGPSTKKAVKELVFAIGKHNLKAKFKSNLSHKKKNILCKISKVIYDFDPQVEKNIVGFLSEKLRWGNNVHKDLRIGYVMKR